MKDILIAVLLIFSVYLYQKNTELHKDLGIANNEYRYLEQLLRQKEIVLEDVKNNITCFEYDDWRNCVENMKSLPF